MRSLLKLAQVAETLENKLQGKNLTDKVQALSVSAYAIKAILPLATYLNFDQDMSLKTIQQVNDAINKFKSSNPSQTELDNFYTMMDNDIKKFIQKFESQGKQRLNEVLNISNEGSKTDTPTFTANIQNPWG